MPSREEINGSETPDSDLTSSYTIPQKGSGKEGVQSEEDNYVLDDPSEELERELAGTTI